MHPWRALHVFYSDVDRLILECAHPLVTEHSGQLEAFFLDRHYAGGPHLRLRLRSDLSTFEELERSLADFVVKHPSEAISDYSEALVSTLVAQEGAEAEDAREVAYRNNVVERHSYPGKAEELVLPEARELMEAFRQDSTPLLVALLADERPRRELLLRMYFATSLIASGDLRSGSVSWKSHWEGFYSKSAPDALVERIRDTYRQQRERVLGHLIDVERIYREEAWSEDPVLEAWEAVARGCQKRCAALLAAGGNLTVARSVEDVRQTDVRYPTLRPSRFMEVLTEHPEFLASIPLSKGMQMPRLLVNCVYSILGTVGLRMVDRFALCFFAHRAVEEHFDCDLTDILIQTRRRVLGDHAPEVQLES